MGGWLKPRLPPTDKTQGNQPRGLWALPTRRGVHSPNSIGTGTGGLRELPALTGFQGSSITRQLPPVRRAPGGYPYGTAARTWTVPRPIDALRLRRHQQAPKGRG